MVNIKGDNIGNIVSDNHYTMAKAKLNKDNGDTFYYVFDESSAVKLRDSESLRLQRLRCHVREGRGCALRQRGEGL